MEAIFHAVFCHVWQQVDNFFIEQPQYCALNQKNMAIFSVILCLIYCIFMLAFYLQLIGVALGALRCNYLWVPALIGLSIYAILMCSQDSWIFIIPKTLGFILDWGGGLLSMGAVIYITWKTFTSWKFFLGMMGVSTVVFLISIMLA